MTNANREKSVAERPLEFDRPAPAKKPGIPVKRGRVAAPPRVIIYGPEGVGKTTLATDAPDSILADLEDGSKHLDVARYEFRPGEPDGHVPKSADEIDAMLETLLVADHPFRSLVLDPVDRLESLIWSRMISRDAKKKKGGEIENIEDYGYGKGYQIALDEWRALLAKLDRLHSVRGMAIVLVGHTSVKTWKNPEGDDFDRYVFRVHEKAAGLLKEWADVVGFFTHETFVEAETDRRGRKVGRPKGLSSGRRILRVERTAAFDAKSRIPLPDEIEITETHPWAPFREAIAEGQSATPEAIVAAIKAECERIGDADLTAKVRASVAAAGVDVAALQRYLNSLRGRAPAANP